MKAWMRWVLVLPAAIGAAAVIQIAITVVNMVSDFLVSVSFLSINSANLTQLTNSIAMGWAFVVAGAKTAPSHRAATALCLTLILNLTLTGLISFVFLYGHESTGKLVWLFVCYLATVVTSIISCVGIRREETAASLE